MSKDPHPAWTVGILILGIAWDFLGWLIPIAAGAAVWIWLNR